MVREEKIRAIEELKNKIESYPVVGILDMNKVPSKPLHETRKKLRGKAIITMTKKSILLRAIKSAKRNGINELENIIPKQPAIIFSDSEPFKLYGTIDRMKIPAPAKAGDIAPKDIEVRAGPTSLIPGPVISELSKAGIPAGVEEGKIVIKKDKVVVKMGDIISTDHASALRKLNINPMEAGLNVVAIFENGMIYGKEALSLVGRAYVNKIIQAFNYAINLSVTICYPTKENIKYLLSKAFMEELGLRLI